MIVAIDFDGTIVEHRFPHIGLPVPGAQGTMRRLVEAGHQIILWTCRTKQDMNDAADYVENNLGIPLHGVNTNQKGDGWTSHPKVFADLYIDDRALGAPLCYPSTDLPPYIDWLQVSQYLVGEGIIPPGKGGVYKV